MLVMDSSTAAPLVIADDLTGATEAALALAESGLGNVAWLRTDEDSPLDGPGCAVNLDTRDMPADEARVRLAEFLGRRQDLRCRTIFKKVDSTARRHLAAEIDVCLRFQEFDVVVVALAAPDDRRRTLHGVHHVGPDPVDRTPFARDLALPTAHLPTLLTAGSARTCSHVPMETIRRGTEAIAEAIASRAVATGTIIAMDCETRDDLHNIAGAVIVSPRRILPVGSAAMLRELLAVAAKPDASAPSPAVEDPRFVRTKRGIDNRSTRPVLVACGSLHPVTRRQVERLCKASGAMSVEVGASDDDASADVLADAVSSGAVAVITTPESRDGGRHSDVQMAARVAALVQAVLARQCPGGLVATGGNISSAVINRLGANGLRALGRLSPVVPVLELVGGPYSGLPIVTKGGGVGSEDILIDAVALLRQLAAK